MMDDDTTTDPTTDAAAADDVVATEADPIADEAPVATEEAPAAPVANTNDTTDKEFVEHVVKQIVEKPEAVKVERTVDEMGVLLTLEVDKDDMGKIIGKSGQTAKALRILLRVIGSKNNARVNLKIVEPGGEEE